MDAAKEHTNATAEGVTVSESAAIAVAPFHRNAAAYGQLNDLISVTAQMLRCGYVEV